MSKITISDLPSIDANLCLDQEMTDIASVYGGFRLTIGNFSIKIGGERLHINYQ